ncbi:MAG: DUF418 domain-containing protein [Bacteroidales bacterium]|nr:DUF418 domain-containing protein [Bacteroidales bacterium]
MYKNSSFLNPTSSTERIVSLDALRGFAILGILIMNIQSFSMISAAYVNPIAFGDFTGVNKWIWILSHVFADQKFMPIFAMLFGAGIVLMSERLDQKGKNTAALHYRRMMWLVIIGLVHAYFLWYGDILFTYAICGLLVFLFRKLTSKWLLIIGVLIFSISSFLYLFFGLSMPYWPNEVLEHSINSWYPPETNVLNEITNYQGNWIQQMNSRISMAFFIQTNMFFMKVAWKTIGLMLIGMALYKWGVFSAELSKKAYIKGTVFGFVFGFPLVVIGVVSNINANWSFEYSMFFGSQFNYWGGVFVSFGYISLIMILVKSKYINSIIKSFSAVGRMALSNYLLQTIICTTIFYGHGFGFFAKANRIEQIIIVLIIWLFQLIASTVYLKYFRYGPFEWFWRSLSYNKIQSFRKK